MPQKNVDLQRRRSFIRALGLFALSPLSALSQTNPIMLVAIPRNDPIDFMAKQILAEAYRQIDISLQFERKAFAGKREGFGNKFLLKNLYSYKSTEILDDQSVRLPEPLFEDELVIYCLSTSPSINSVEDLHGQKLGTTSLLAESLELQKLLKETKFETGYSLKKALEMMLTGKGDVVIGSRLSGQHAFRELEAKGYFEIVIKERDVDMLHRPFNRSEIKVSKLAIGSLPVYHHVPRILAQEIPRLQKILSQMRVDRRTEKIQQTIINDVNEGKNEFDVASLAEIRRLSELREIPYSKPMLHQEAIKINLLSNERAALKQLRMSGVRWNWRDARFQSAYAEALTAVSEIQNADWDKCTYPVMQKYASERESLAAEYESSMPYAWSYMQFKEVLNFFESKLGSKYRQFLRFAANAYLELDLVRQKRDLGYPDFTTKYIMPVENSSELRLMRNGFELFFGETEFFLLDFIVYVPDFIQRINTIFNQQEQIRVLVFLDTEAATIERKIVRQWQGKVGMDIYSSDRKCETSSKLQAIKLQPKK
ncbi:type 2 periplasmic-binding domain-containing protein [Undibacterium flavidum]|uniref:Solute-binding protein family 3/N-terminal domain-containing protein n=1 Tax=Undibacterium flavidum TaxID=2762297 RepID=A0ABR6YFC4_9BURK|nr:hypothetical protein [Undibacterium flavidum]MBC3875179.1 hypothetical protein [Undibacterium flavidum]